MKKDDKNGIKRSKINGWHSKPFDLKKKDSKTKKNLKMILKFYQC